LLSKKKKKKKKKRKPDYTAWPGRKALGMVKRQRDWAIRSQVLRKAGYYYSVFTDAVHRLDVGGPKYIYIYIYIFIYLFILA